jgi:hypothetical protein
MATYVKLVKGLCQCSHSLSFSLVNNEDVAGGFAVCAKMHIVHRTFYLSTQGSDSRWVVADWDAKGHLN